MASSTPLGPMSWGSEPTSSNRLRIEKQVLRGMLQSAERRVVSDPRALLRRPQALTGGSDVGTGAATVATSDVDVAVSEPE